MLKKTTEQQERCSALRPDRKGCRGAITVSGEGTFRILAEEQELKWGISRVLSVGGSRGVRVVY